MFFAEIGQTMKCRCDIILCALLKVGLGLLWDASWGRGRVCFWLNGLGEKGEHPSWKMEMNTQLLTVH